MFLRRMMIGANRKENADEIRRIEDLLRGACDDIELVKQNTADVPWLSKFMGNLFKYGGGEAEKKYPPRKK
jgi:hypothetical protein